MAKQNPKRIYNLLTQLATLSRENPSQQKRNTFFFLDPIKIQVNSSPHSADETRTIENESHLSDDWDLGFHMSAFSVSLFGSEVPS